MTIYGDIIVLIRNPIVISCFFTYIIIQLLKVATYSYKEKKLHLVSFFETGGMPSSHSGIVTALTISLFLYDGVSSLFVVSCVFSAIVIRDSYGVRKSVGDQSLTINQLIQLINSKMKSKKQQSTKQKATNTLNLVQVIRGHTVLQVSVGIIIGIAVPAIIYFLF